MNAILYGLLCCYLGEVNAMDWLPLVWNQLDCLNTVDILIYQNNRNEGIVWKDKKLKLDYDSIVL